MSDLREAIRTIIYESDTDKLPDAVLAVITAHLTVTDADADMFADFGEREGVRSVLESFVARKLKAETI